MKVYIVSGLVLWSGDPIFEVFSNKMEAEKRLSYLKKDSKNEMFGIYIPEFPISKQGILDAIRYGANTIYK